MGSIKRKDCNSILVNNEVVKSASFVRSAKDNGLTIGRRRREWLYRPWG